MPSDLITNGSFTGSASGWTLESDWVYASNHAVFLTALGNSLKQSGLITEFSTDYVLELDITFTSAGSIVAYLVSSGSETQIGNPFTANGHYARTVTTQSSSNPTQDTIKFVTFGGAGYIDNVTFKKAIGLQGNRSPSLISAVSRVQQNNEFPQFVIGGEGTGDQFMLFKKTDSYGSVPSMWRSPVYQIGKNFDVLSIKFAIVGGVSVSAFIYPVLYFDNESSYSVGNSIDSSTYPNGDTLIKLGAKNFSNGVHGKNNFFLELQIGSGDLSVFKLPIMIDIEVEDQT